MMKRPAAGLLCRLAVLAVLACTLPLHAANQYGPTKAGETLWRAATEVQARYPGASTAQVAWALYRTNPGAFDRGPAGLKPGSTLTLPQPSVVNATDKRLAHDYITGKKPLPDTETAATAKPEVTTPEPMSADDPLAAIVLNPELAIAAAPAPAPSDPPAPEAVWVPPPPEPERFRDTQLGTQMLDLVNRGGQPEQVHRALAPLEDRWAGDADFDYALGTALFDLGEPGRATYVLNRAVRTRPGFSGARMALARAYFEVGDNESARREFEVLKSEDPPPAARRAIASYLDAIDQKAAAYVPHAEAFAELGAGFDSNANGATDAQTFLGFTLNEQNQATESGYYGLVAGGSLSRPLSPSWRFVGDGSLNWRGHPDASFVDAQALRLAAGMQWRRGIMTLGLVPNGTYALLDGEPNHTRYGVDSQLAWALGRSRLSVLARYGSTRYEDLLSVQDVNSALVGLGGETVLGSRGTWLLSGAITAGQEDAVEDGSPFGRNLVGLRGALSVNLTPRNTVTLQLAGLESDYDGDFFGEPRTDQRISAGLLWRARHFDALGWRLGTHVNFVDNSSDVDLYDHDRIEAGVTVRRVFR